jgi:uncharacterized protein
MNKNVAILGASINEERYSNKVQKFLIEKGFNVFPINPNYKEIGKLQCYSKLLDIKEQIGTLTVYMNPIQLKNIVPEIITKKPDRIIFNPGTENEEIENILKNEGIEIIEACTLVLLKTNSF